MRLTLLLAQTFLFFSTYQAAEQSNFYFLRAPEEIKKATETPDILSKIAKMNVDCRYFEISKDILEPETVQQYVWSLESIVASLYQVKDYLDLKSPEILEFTLHLLDSIEKDFDKFTDNKLFEVFRFFIAAGTSETAPRIRTIFVKHIKTLKPIPRLKILQALVKHASTETVFLIPTMLTESFVSADRIKRFLDEYIPAVFSRIPRENYSNYINAFHMNLMCVAKVDLELNPRTYELLLTGIKESVVNIRADFLETLLESLDLIFDQVEYQNNLARLIIDCFLAEAVVGAINSEDFNANIMNLMIKCSKADSVYFKSKIEDLPMAAIINLNSYMKQLKTATLALICFDNLRKMTGSLDEGQYKIALSSIKNLINIYKTCPVAVKSISNFANTMHSVIVEQASVFSDYDHPNNSMSLRLVAYLAILGYEMAGPDQRVETSGNISYCVGHLLTKFARSSDSEFPTELINDVLPILDGVIENMSKLRATLTKPMNALDLAARIKFVNLHPSKEVIQSATDQLCLIFLTSMPIKSKGYLYVRDLDYTDEAGIAVNGFLYYVQEFIKSPKREDLEHLKEYFDYLTKKKFLCKTQKLIRNLMIKAVLLQLLFVSLSFASKLSRFSFKKDLEKLKNCLESGEDYRQVLNSFNSDTRQMYADSFGQSQETLKEYISIKEELIYSLLKSPWTNYKHPEIDVFNAFLVEELPRYESLFSPENFHLVLSFLLRASSKTNVDVSRSIASKMVDKLSGEQVKEFVRFLSSNEEFEDKISGIDERIKELSKTLDPEGIFQIIREISEEKMELTTESYEILADKLNNLELFNSDRLFVIFGFLEHASTKVKNSQIFTQSVADFVFSENVVDTIKNLELNHSYSMLLYFVSRNAELFREKLQTMPFDIAHVLEPYANILHILAKLYKYIKLVKTLNDNSSETDFKLAISAIGNLIKLKETDNFVRKVLKVECEDISDAILNFSSIFTVSIHPLYAFSWKVVGMIGLLNHDLSDDKNFISNCFSNIVSGFGHVLLDNPSEISFVNQYIEGSFSHMIGTAIESALANIKEFKTPVRYINLQAAIKFIQLYPSIEERNFFIDRFCSQFISDVAPQFNKYFKIKDLEITDERGVYVASFLTFLENYVQNPNESKLSYLREYFLFLKSSKFLSKTETILLETRFKSFKKLFNK